MLKKRLNGLIMCSIEIDVLDDDIDLDIVFKDYASRNAERQLFTRHRSIYFYLR